MFEAKIIAGYWDEETITLKGVPKDFVLSARNLIVLETDEYNQLQSELERLKEEARSWRSVAERLEREKQALKNRKPE